MSEVKVGDRVRVVIEGEVHHVTQDGFLDVAGVYYSSELGGYGVVSIEAIPEPFVLPTKRWAQVVDKEGWLWTRQSTAEDELTGLPTPPHWFNAIGRGIDSSYLIQLPGLRIISEGVDDE
jgi:hypothetical protein